MSVPQRAIRAAVGAAAVALAAALAGAQGVDIHATAEAPGGLARAWAYVPVRLALVNRTDETFETVRVESGGPVAVCVPWRLAPAASDERVVPVFYAGGELALRVVLESADGRAEARGRVDALELRPLADGAALVGVERGTREPQGEAVEALARALGGRTPQFVELSGPEMARAARLGLLDGAVVRGPDAPEGDVAVARQDKAGAWRVEPSPFPRGVRSPVQDEAFDLLGGTLWPAADRARLWLWLGLFALAVLAAGLFVPRRRTIRAAVVMVGLALVAMDVIWLSGGVRKALSVEARICYAREAGAPRAGLERLVWLGSRGGEISRAPLRPADPLPLPILAAPDDPFRPVGTLWLGEAPAFEAAGGAALVHVLGRDETPTLEEPLADLRVEADRADPGDGPRPLSRWAAERKASADADRAFAGRSLEFWAATRREDDSARRLVWVREAPRTAAEGRRTAVRQPTLVVLPAGPRGEAGRSEGRAAGVN